MLAMPAAPRNSLRALRALRSDRRGENEDDARCARGAGIAALLGCAQARPWPTARAFAGDGSDE